MLVPDLPCKACPIGIRKKQGRVHGMRRAFVSDPHKPSQSACVATEGFGAPPRLKGLVFFE